MRLLIVTDAWYPQVNGVVRTLDTVAREASLQGHTVGFVTPDQFRTLPMPTYPEIRLALFPGRRLARLIASFKPDAIHIATEGPLGWAARRLCLKRGLPFTTAYHTRFPEYVQARFRVPAALTFRLMRRFHAPSRGLMVATRSLFQELAGRGFANLRQWSRGVDLERFTPGPKDILPDLPRPIFTYVGRLAVEKNIDAFLALDLPGSKLVVGDGPEMARLKAAYPQVHFAGARHGDDLTAHFRAGDVFVFPSRTDTFGLVVLEALACGLPVAAYPVPGPADILTPETGALDEDLRSACLRALGLDPAACRAHALSFTWGATAAQFVENIAPFRQDWPAQAVATGRPVAIPHQPGPRQPAAHQPGETA
ncbi:glycosyltransferase family 4 protein [Zavarzinia compransoris]|uniref:Alpha-mannosyltransferase n=1 Tax=Zavarzinia compransoris TaxID=1264899 RepID=A0A317DXI0_9PROT|nr:glycosyltransferase family 1 protein [Zavarzinia compransoris]PWR19211.1 alpha-mannosyltransferase [Zavarzinia compransoris]